MKKLGCLHAHHSNIDYIERALAGFDMELMHFVDPGVMTRVTHDEHFSLENAKKKVRGQVAWMIECGCDAIVITCTNYISLLDGDMLLHSVPIFPIDIPLFECICKVQQPQLLLFSNPATVEGTMKRLQAYAERITCSLQIEIMVMEDAFELLMQGKTEEYEQTVVEYIKDTIKAGDKVVSVAQLSMVGAAQLVMKETSTIIINPLDALITNIVLQLRLQKKR